MKMFLATGTCGFLLFASSGLAAAQATEPGPSLAEMARTIREQKAASAPKAKRVYDNQNMPHDPNAAWRANARESGAEETPAPAAAAATDKKDDKKDKGPGGDSEQTWRARFAKARENLNTETRRLDVLQRELNLAQIQNYSDPNQALRESVQRTDITKRTTEIDAQRQVVENAKKALSDLEDQARQKGVPNGWMQP